MLSSGQRCRHDHIACVQDGAAVQVVHFQERAEGAVYECSVFRPCATSAQCGTAASDVMRASQIEDWLCGGGDGTCDSDSDPVI